MSPAIAACLVGLYIVPLALLATGHRVRRASQRVRRAFWGAIVGYIIAGVLAVAFAILTPAYWSDSDTVRGFFGLWGMLILPALGGVVAMLRPLPNR